MKKPTIDKKVQEIFKAEKYIEDHAIEATILFADLVGSTQYKAKHGAADGLKRALKHNGIISNIIIANKGNVIKYIGDEVMALFESPDSALLTALQVNQEWQRTHEDPPIETKIGLHKGEVRFFQYPGSKIPDPQGTTVDMAARIVSYAKGRQILFSEQVKSSTSRKWEIADTQEFIPKGFTSKIVVHSLKFDKCETQIKRPEFVSLLDEATAGILDDAKHELSKRNFKAAKGLAERVLKIEPENPEANYIIGVAVTVGISKDIDKGIFCLEKTIYHKPDHYRAIHFLSYLLWLKNEKDPDFSKIERAVNLARECIRHAQSSNREDRYTEFLAQGSLAYYLGFLGGEENLKEAVELCKTVEEFFARLSTVNYSKFLDTYGFVLMKCGSLDEARKKFEQALEADRNNDYAHFHIAELLRM